MAFAFKSSLLTGLGVLCLMIPSSFAMEKEAYKVALINNAGEQVGTADLEETTKGVLITIDVSGVGEAGERAIHIHEIAACSPIKTFKNAGGHYNPNEEAHGLHHENGTHAGDMPNLIVREDGTVKVKILNTFITLDEEEKDGRAPLFDEDGSALMIHAGADDYKSQPSGAAGGRIVCGVITNQVEAEEVPVE